MSRRRGRRRSAFRLKFKRETIYSLTSLGFLGLACITILSFTRQGIIFVRLNDLLEAYFSWASIFLPFLLVIAGLMLTQLKWRITRPNTFLGSVIAFISLIGIFRTGIAGESLWFYTQDMITSPGALLIFLGVFFVGYIVATETTIDEILLFFTQILKFIQQLVKPRKLYSTPITINQPQNIAIKGMTDDKNLRDQKPQEIKKNPLPNTKAPNQTGTINQTLNVPTTTVWKSPPMSILADTISGKADRGDLKNNAAIIEKTLESFGIRARVVEVNLGPAVTQYALEIALGTKLSKITALQNDLALALAAPTGQIRIEAPIPGRALVGVEIPNRIPEFVTLKKMLESQTMKKMESKLAISLGLDVSGEPVVADIARMPHVLIAGSTGSGKSVCLNAFIATILFRASPDEVKFILVDPKRVELTQYNGIPHLLTPVIVEPEKVISALKWALAEMDRRYKVFAEVGARNIEGYNELSGFQAMPYLVVVIDELADIMLFAPSEVEDCITRLAQMARATGIHLIVSTQRPSVDVITGLIKANIPARIAFNVTSMVDSRVIIDTPGAEKLLGKGDMLFIPPDKAKPARIQGTYVSEPEIRSLIDHLRSSGVSPHYTEEVTTQYTSKKPGMPGDNNAEDRDEVFEQAVRVVCEYDRASASLLQRRLSIGYARAARLLDQLESAGIVSAPEGSKPREVLIRNADEFLSQHGK